MASGFVGWIYGEPDGSRVGPLTTEALIALLDQGVLRPKQWVWRACKDRLGTHYYPTLADVAHVLSQPAQPEASGLIGNEPKSS